MSKKMPIFSIIKDYNITHGVDESGSVNCATIIPEDKKAHIYPWGGWEDDSVEKYIFHEHLHIAIAELMYNYSKEKEELLVQEITEIIFN